MNDRTDGRVESFDVIAEKRLLLGKRAMHGGIVSLCRGRFAKASD